MITGERASASATMTASGSSSMGCDSALRFLGLVCFEELGIRIVRSRKGFAVVTELPVNGRECTKIIACSNASF